MNYNRRVNINDAPLYVLLLPYAAFLLPSSSASSLLVALTNIASGYFDPAAISIDGLSASGLLQKEKVFRLF